MRAMQQDAHSLARCTVGCWRRNAAARIELTRMLRQQTREAGAGVQAEQASSWTVHSDGVGGVQGRAAVKGCARLHSLAPITAAYLAPDSLPLGSLQAAGLCSVCSHCELV